MTVLPGTVGNSYQFQQREKLTLAVYIRDWTSPVKCSLIFHISMLVVVLKFFFSKGWEEKRSLAGLFI